MKITGMEIGEYRQFKNFNLDFTYPKDHPKAGQPLEKVCFIGQSGTGKTTLLNIMWDFYRNIDDAIHSLTSHGFIHNENSLVIGPKFAIDVDFGNQRARYEEEDFSNYESRIKEVRVSYLSPWLLQYIEKLNVKDKICLFVEDSIATTSAHYLHRQFHKDDDTVFDTNTVEQRKIKRKAEYDFIKKSKSVSVSYDYAQYFWQYVLSEIYNFDEELKRIAIELFKINSLTPNKLQTRINTWQEEHENPRLELAQKCVNPILKNLRLEFDIDETKEPISIKTSSGVSIPGYALSTGAKQLLSTAIAIFKSDIDDGVILFDEPERSLFPDIQRELVKYYISLAPEAQFFFATHSPIIASAFEPCERFILYFDDNGDVKYRNGVAPIGDDPNDLLSSDFGLNELMLDEGLKAYAEYRKLGVEIRDEKDSERQNKLIAKRAKLGDDYNF